MSICYAVGLTSSSSLQNSDHVEFSSDSAVTREPLDNTQASPKMSTQDGLQAATFDLSALMMLPSPPSQFDPSLLNTQVQQQYEELPTLLHAHDISMDEGDVV